jgi:transposase
MTQLLLPDLPGFSLEQITLEGGMITVFAHSQTTKAPCPECSHVSSRIHGRYTRRLADLPWSGRTVRLEIQVRRFVCLRQACPRKTFSEALPALAERFARRTTRLADLLLKLGLTAGGEAGARLTHALNISCSPDTLLRCVRRAPREPIPAPRVIGIDDWAWRKGHRYGTIICDLERHQVIDLLADRNATSVAKWLKHYPSIEVVSRDRSDIYAQGARLGAPQAIQVADRWHLLKNLEEVVQRLLAHHLAVHRKRQ